MPKKFVNQEKSVNREEPIIHVKSVKSNILGSSDNITEKATSSFPSTIYLTFYLGIADTIEATLHSNDPMIINYPGKYLLESYDPDYLQITNLEWFPGYSGLNNPLLAMRVIPLKLGTTNLRISIQYDKFQGLFVEKHYQIKIIDANSE